MARDGIQVWPAFTDLMGGVAVVLLLLGAAAVDNARAEQTALKKQLVEAQRTLGVGRKLVWELRATLQTHKIEANINDYGNLEISADLLFSSGQFDIPALRQEDAIKMGETLLSLLSNEVTSKSIALILVVGHTDSEGKAEYNLELSVKRAHALVSLWLRTLLPSAETDVSQMCKAAKLVAAGMGESRPLVSEETAEACGNKPHELKGCRKNRRIEIRVVPKEERMKEVANCP